MDKALTGLLMNSQKSGSNQKHATPIFPRTEAFGRGWAKYAVACGTLACVAVMAIKAFSDIYFTPLPRYHREGGRQERV